MSGLFLYMAEKEGFEPSVPVKVHTLSKRAPSATRTLLRMLYSKGAQFILFL